jgi:hypothetical protein
LEKRSIAKYNKRVKCTFNMKMELLILEIKELKIYQALWGTT